MEQPLQPSGQAQNIPTKKVWYKRWWVIGLGVLFLYSIGSNSFDEAKKKAEEAKNNANDNKQVTQQQETKSEPVKVADNNSTPDKPDATPSAADKAEAQKELDSDMALAKKAKLVSSYEFSDKASVIYVTDVWNGLTVEFKKDFLAKNAMLKKKITGYQHFEVRNYKSNEKVAEVTAFTGSLEVYK